MLLIPGLDGDPSLVRAAAAHLFPGMHVLPFGHRTDAMGDGVDGLADRALATLDGDGSDAPTFVCGESFGGMVALTLARRHPSRVRGLILLSAFGRYPLLNSWSGRLSLRVWRMLGNMGMQRVLRLWRFFSLPCALGLVHSRDLTRLYLGRHSLTCQVTGPSGNSRSDSMPGPGGAQSAARPSS